MAELESVGHLNENSQYHCIFIHGLTGNKEATWTAKTDTGSVFWPHLIQQELPDIFSYWSFGYKASASDWKGSAMFIEDRAKNLLELLATEASLQKGKIVLIGHSMGGLIAKQMLRLAFDASSDHEKQAFFKQVVGMVFLATPHKGSKYASYLSCIPFIRPSEALQDLAKDSRYLISLNEWFRTNSPHLKVLSLSETQKVPTLGIQVVSTESADAGVSSRPILVDENHISIAKPSSNKAEVHRLVRHYLKSIPDRIELPAELDEAEEIAGQRGLRGRLRSSAQPYIEAQGEANIEHLLARLDDTSRPLLITGDGGLGKTRLALELVRNSQRRGVAILESTSLQTLETFVKDCIRNNEPTALILDYLENSQLSFNSLHNLIRKSPKGIVALIITTRDASRNSLFSAGDKLNNEDCYEVSLNSSDYLTWRQQTCREILQTAKLEDDFIQELNDLDIPLIATLLAYDQEQGHQTDVKDYRHNGYWLLRRLDRTLLWRDGRKFQDFVLLLTLFPFSDNVQAQLSDDLKRSLDALQDAGWVTAHQKQDTTEWRLGHDLLSDIPLATYLHNQKDTPLRCQKLAELTDQAAALGAHKTFARSLARSLRRILAEIPAKDCHTILRASIPALANSFLNEQTELFEFDSDTDKETWLERIISPITNEINTEELLTNVSDFSNLDEHLSRLIEQLALIKNATPKTQRTKEMLQKALLSFSLNIFEKIRVLESTPTLSIFQIDGLSKVFDEDVEELKEASKNKTEQVPLAYEIFINAMGDINQIEKFSDLYKITLNELDESSELWGLTAKYIPQFYPHLSQYPTTQFERIREKSELPQYIVVVVKALLAYLQGDNTPYPVTILKDDSPAKSVARLTVADHSYDSLKEEPDQLNKCILFFTNDTYGPVREQAAKAAFIQANNIAKATQNPDAYNLVIELFANDTYGPVRERAAKTAFIQANDIATATQNPDAYNLVIERFANDTYGPVRELAAQAAFIQAYEIAKATQNPDAYNIVIERFAKDAYGPVREPAADAAFIQALNIAKATQNPDAYNLVIERFANDTYGPVREQAANAAFNQANDIATETQDPNAFNKMFELFSGDSYPAIYKQVLDAQQAQLGWMVVARQQVEAQALGQQLLENSEVEPIEHTVIAFLLWLSQPNAQTREQCQTYMAMLDDEESGWTFDEFAELISELSPEERTFAQQMIARLEQQSSDE